MEWLAGHLEACSPWGKCCRGREVAPVPQGEGGYWGVPQHGGRGLPATPGPPPAQDECFRAGRKKRRIYRALLPMVLGGGTREDTECTEGPVTGSQGFSYIKSYMMSKLLTIGKVKILLKYLEQSKDTSQESGAK